MALTRKLLQCAVGLNWLNDEVINSTMALYQERERRKNPLQPKVHFWSTFFYEMLQLGKKGYDIVLRWSKRLPYCLLQCDKIVVPINQGQLHWVLTVIHVRETRVEFLDSMGGKDKGSQVRTMMDNDRYQKSRTTHQP